MSQESAVIKTLREAVKHYNLQQTRSRETNFIMIVAKICVLCWCTADYNQRILAFIIYCLKLAINWSRPLFITTILTVSSKEGILTEAALKVQQERKGNNEDVDCDETDGGSINDQDGDQSAVSDMEDSTVRKKGTKLFPSDSLRRHRERLSKTEYD